MLPSSHQPPIVRNIFPVFPMAAWAKIRLHHILCIYSFEGHAQLVDISHNFCRAFPVFEEFAFRVIANYLRRAARLPPYLCFIWATGELSPSLFKPPAGHESINKKAPPAFRVMPLICHLLILWRTYTQAHYSTKKITLQVSNFLISISRRNFNHIVSASAP